MDSLEVPRPSAMPAPADPTPRRSAKRKKDKPSAAAAPSAPPEPKLQEDSASEGTLDVLA